MIPSTRRTAIHGLPPGIARRVIDKHRILEHILAAEQGATMAAGRIGRIGDVVVSMTITKNSPTICRCRILVERAVRQRTAWRAIKVEPTTIAATGVGKKAGAADDDLAIADTHGTSKPAITSAIRTCRVVLHRGPVDDDAIGRIDPQIGTTTISVPLAIGDLAAADGHIATDRIIRIFRGSVGTDGPAITEATICHGGVSRKGRIHDCQRREKAIHGAAIPGGVVLENAADNHQRAAGVHAHRATPTTCRVADERAVDHFNLGAEMPGNGATDAGTQIHRGSSLAIGEGHVAHGEGLRVSHLENAAGATAIQCDKPRSINDSGFGNRDG